MKTWKHTAVLLLVIILLAALTVAHVAATEKWDAALLAPTFGQSEKTDSTGTEVPVQKEKSPVVWIVLFGVSLSGNIVQLILMIWKKKEYQKQQIDDVPLVDYDIDDDVI